MPVTASVSSTTVCPNCGKEFFKGANRIQRFCSRQCKNQAGEKRRWPRHDRTVSCEVCKSTFTTNKPWGKFCSMRCYNSAKRSRHNGPGKRVEKRVMASCGECGVQFSQPRRYYVKRFSERTPKFCSLACAYKSRTREGAVYRGKGWVRIANEIRGRDGHKCFCGVEKRGKRKLPVDHIIPFRLMKQWGMEPNDDAT